MAVNHLTVDEQSTQKLTALAVESELHADRAHGLARGPAPGEAEGVGLAAPRRPRRDGQDLAPAVFDLAPGAAAPARSVDAVDALVDDPFEFVLASHGRHV